MSGVQGMRATLGQRDAPDVELIVSGTHTYATYQTLDGYPAVYDNERGLFCYARLENGRLLSTGVPVTAPPPAGVQKNAKESDAVRAEKIKARDADMDRRSRNTTTGNQPPSGTEE
jgi:hypothetical protein